MIPFTKMQAIGNDFVVVTVSDAAGRALDLLAISTCDRKFGIGADGLLVIGPAEGSAAFHFRMFNPDGTEDMCGNGLRCACLFGIRQGLVDRAPSTFKISSKDGIHKCRVLTVSDDLRESTSEIDMGQPHFDPAEIPYSGPTIGSTALGVEVKIQNDTYILNAVNTGSTHSVLFRDAEPPDHVFTEVSALLENHPDFPERTSVLWAWPDGPRGYRVRIWERGADETLGCGTGGAAVAATALATNRIAFGDPLTVTSKGGTLTLDWPSAESTMLMRGPASFVYRGRWLDLPHVR